MKFEKVIGDIDPDLVSKAEERLTDCLLSMSVKYDNVSVGGIGGDPLIWALLSPVQHVATLNMPTAATDGLRFYINPKFCLKQSKLGLRFIMSHEAWHAIYMHPQRRGSRMPRLWNIAVDYIVNGMILDDLKNRNIPDYKESFKTNLGKYKTIKEYGDMLKDPYANASVMKQLQAYASGKTTVPLPDPSEDRELTLDEKEAIDKAESDYGSKFFFADPDMHEDLRSPEKIYDHFYALLPKCPKCGSIGKYKKPGSQKSKPDKKDQNKQGKKDKSDQQDQDKKDKSDQKQPGKTGCQDPSCQDKSCKGDQPSDQPGDQEGGNQPGDKPGDQPGDGSGNNPGGSGENCCDDEGCGSGNGKGGGCDSCGDGYDIFDLGGLVDDHMDSEEEQEQTARRVSEAINLARKTAGYVPSAIEDELGVLTKPKMRWQDIVRSKMSKARAGNKRNDWNRFQSRPMFAGLMNPKRKSNFITFGCLLDTSGSMSNDDMAFGISQLASLDDKAEGTIVPADADIYWDKATKIKKCNAEELKKVKVEGRGGTVFGNFTSDYEQHIGKCDFLVFVTDGYLIDSDLASMKNPGIDVIWILTSGVAGFKPPFGRVFSLRNDQ